MAVISSSWPASATGGSRRAHHIGLSKPSQRVAVGCERPGRIAEVLVREGDEVTKGQLIFRLDNELQRVLTERLLIVATSTVDERKAQAEVEHYEREERRSRELAKERIKSETELAVAELDAKLARVRLDKAREDRELAKKSWEESRIVFERGIVASPLDGFVTAVIYQAGRTVDEFEPVLEVVDLDPLWVEFHCPVEEETSFRPGSKVAVHRVGHPEDVREAVVVHASMQADPSSQTFPTRLEMKNDKDPWKAGLKVVITAHGGVAHPPPGPGQKR